MTDVDLTGKTAIVTGAARGLGRSYALRLAERGARVAVMDRNLTSFTEFDEDAKQMTAGSTVEEILASGGSSLGFEGDVSDRFFLDRMAQVVTETWGSIDILVANAGGGSGSFGTTLAAELDPAMLDEVFQRNLYGTIYSVNAVAPTMIAQGSGKIITLSSIGGSQSSKTGGYAHYGVAKAGIAMYTRYVAQHLGPSGITANCIAPGVIATARVMTNVAAGAWQPSDIALRRVGTVKEVTDLVEFLSGPGSDYITGAVIPIDGGLNHGPA
jgi:3-oxoacyl-[acyl-carrier protein] reductase